MVLTKENINYYLLVLVFFIVYPPLAIGPMVYIFYKNGLWQNVLGSIVFSISVFLILSIIRILVSPQDMEVTLVGTLYDICYFVGFVEVFSILVYFILKKAYSTITHILLISIPFVIIFFLLSYFQSKNNILMPEISKFIDFFNSNGLSDQSAINQFKENIMFFSNVLLPKLILFFGFFHGFMIFQHICYFNAKADVVPNIVSIDKIRIKHTFSWIFLGILYVYLTVIVLLKVKNQLLENILYNLLIGSGSILAFQGYGVAAFYIKKYKMDVFFKKPLFIIGLVLLMLFFILSVAPIVVLFLFILGIMDNIMKFRKFE